MNRGGADKTLGKFNPNSKARGAANGNWQKTKTLQPIQTGVADGYGVTPTFSSRPGQSTASSTVPGTGIGRFMNSGPKDPKGHQSTSTAVKSSQEEFRDHYQDSLGYTSEEIAQYQRDPQLIGKKPDTNFKSQEEACTILQAEAENLVQNPACTDIQAGEPPYDYKTNGPGPLKYAEIKVPRHDSLADARRLGRAASLKCNDEDVALVVNLNRLRPEKRQAYAEEFTRAALISPDRIKFLNL